MTIIPNKTICIIGLGYVGLPLACQVAAKGYTVYGFDVNKEIVEKTNTGICHMKDDELQKKLTEVAGKLKATTDASIIKQCNIIIVCVPTPVYHNFSPNLEYIKSSAEAIAKHLKKDDLVVVESTIYPGTIEEVVLPILEKSGLKVGTDFHLAHCPERIDPGNKKWTIANLPRVVGGTTVEATDVAYNFYSSIIDAPITKLSSVKAAEATKIVENTFRDVNIAFVNELAKSFDHLNIDVVEVIKGAATKPFAFLPHFPGAGVGGHCFDKNEWIFVKIDDAVHTVKIGELYELIKYYNCTEIGDTHLVNPGRLEVLSFDLQTKKACYKPVKLLSKRPYNKMLQINASSVYSIKVSDKHPVVVFEDNQMKIKLADELTNDDRLVISTKLPTIYTEINDNNNVLLLKVNQKRIIAQFNKIRKSLKNETLVEFFNDFATITINSIEQYQGDNVYSLEVEDTNTVVTTNGLVMHNCISVDPYYLIERAKENGFTHNFLVLAREINNSMPHYTIQRTIAGLNQIHKSIKGTKITVLGVSYKPNVDDHRESPAFKVIEELKKLGATLQVYDPYLPKYSTVKTLQEALQAECLVLVTAHNEFLQMDIEAAKQAGVKVIIDGRNCLDKEKIKALGIIYKGIGR